jgi:hypothetical protein
MAFHYVRWKALLFGGLPIALAGVMIWVGIQALDPAWTAQVPKGQYLVDAPVWIRSPVIFTTAIAVLLPGLWMFWAGVSRSVVATFDSHSISARTLYGRRRRLDWASIVIAKRKRNQLILSPSGTGTLGQEIWDRKSVLLDVGMLEAPVGEIERLVLRQRADLVFRDVK